MSDRERKQISSSMYAYEEELLNHNNKCKAIRIGNAVALTSKDILTEEHETKSYGKI